MSSKKFTEQVTRGSKQNFWLRYDRAGEERLIELVTALTADSAVKEKRNLPPYLFYFQWTGPSAEGIIVKRRAKHLSPRLEQIFTPFSNS